MNTGIAVCLIYIGAFMLLSAIMAVIEIRSERGWKK